MKKPKTYQQKFSKLPGALAPLIERPQWCVWLWIQQQNGKWQKPPYLVRDPNYNASSTDPSAWSDYAAAVAVVRDDRADGITYVLGADDQLAAIDLDHCRDIKIGAINDWAQLFLERARDTYSEITPSGTGIRIWGFAKGDKLHRKFSLSIDGKEAAVELFRKLDQPLTVTGYTLDPAISKLVNIDRLMDWAVAFGERHKAAIRALVSANSFTSSNGEGLSLTIEQIEQVVSAGIIPDGFNRSDMFHSIVGHYIGCDWPAAQILEHLQQYPSGIGEKYIHEGRLQSETARCYRKWHSLPPLTGGDLIRYSNELMRVNPKKLTSGRPHRTIRISRVIPSLRVMIQSLQRIWSLQTIQSLQAILSSQSMI